MRCALAGPESSPPRDEVRPCKSRELSASRWLEMTCGKHSTARPSVSKAPLACVMAPPGRAERRQDRCYLPSVGARTRLRAHVILDAVWAGAGGRVRAVCAPTRNDKDGGRYSKHFVCAF